MLTRESAQLAAGDSDITGPGIDCDDGGAVWLRTTDFGDDKDRDIERSTGQTTYFAADVAYAQAQLANTVIRAPFAGTVVKIDKDEVLVDIGYKSEGVIPIRELSIRHDVDPNEIVSMGEGDGVHEQVETAPERFADFAEDAVEHL